MRKIILVESGPEQINIYRRMFEKTDFDVELAISKNEMLEELRQIRNGDSAKPDLVVLDFMLADGHGVEILRAMKKNYFTRDIPVFAVTNYQNNDFEHQIQQLEIMPEKYLIKAHHTPAELIDIMNRYLERDNRGGTTLS
jgi:CheY-like chemotaxis protein